MKLFYSPGTCSLSVHIALIESGLPFEPVRASTKTHQLDDGTDYYGINPLGYVPLLELDNGQRLTEVPALLQYVADQVPEKALAPALGSFERYQLMAWLNVVGTELHKNYSPLFNPAVPDDVKELSRTRLRTRLSWVDEHLSRHDFLMGKAYSVADAYLFVVAGWSKYVALDLSGYAHLGRFLGRVAERPGVQAALKAEGLAG